MVAVISTGKSIYGALAYNEHKIGKGDATSLGVVNSMANAARQNLNDKDKTLQKLADRNQRTKRNSVHIALSFAKDDKLDSEQLRKIAKEYLTGIGFGKQPAYIYRHHDTANDHIHIVTTNIDRDGKRIDDSFIGATKSEETRKAIEQRHGLTVAVKAGEQQSTTERLADLPKPAVEAGGGQLKSYARHTVRDVLKAYRPTTINELNAVLRRHDLKVLAREGEGPDKMKWKGYSVARLDARTGKETSVAIKASRVFDRGWGSKLEQQLVDNAAKRDPSLKATRKVVETAFAQADVTVEKLRGRLAEAGVRAVEHHNEQGRRYGIHYVHDASGHIFKASEVGRKYSAAAWNKLNTDRATTIDHEQLAKNMNGYVKQQQEMAGFQSPVLEKLSAKRLGEVLGFSGYESAQIGADVAEFVAAAKKDYPRAVKEDERLIKSLYWTVAKAKPAYRAGLLADLGMEVKEGRVVAATDHRIGVPIANLVIPPSPEKDRPVKSLTPSERLMLAGVGRYRGIASIPRSVNLRSVDWSEWKDTFGHKTAVRLKKKCHDNSVKLVLDRVQAGRENNKPARVKLAELAQSDVLIKPTQDGYRMYLVGSEEHALQVPRSFAQELDKAGYSEQQYQALADGVKVARGMKTLSPERERELQSKLENQFAALRAASAFVSPATAKLSTADVSDGLSRQGYDKERIRPYVAEFVGQAKSAYAGEVKQDERALKALYWGVAKAKPAVRTALLEKLELEVVGNRVVLRDNPEVGVPLSKLKVTTGTGADELRARTLTSNDRELFAAIGRYRGIDQLAEDVNLGTTDWAYWKGTIGKKTVGEVEKKLHDNYLNKTLAEGDNKDSTLGARLNELAAKNIAIAPTPTGDYRAVVVNAHGVSLAESTGYDYKITEELADRLRKAGYQQTDYESTVDKIKAEQARSYAAGRTPYKRLKDEVDAHRTAEQQTSRWQSPAIKQLSEEKLTRVLLKAGYTQREIAPHRARLVAETNEGYAAAVKADSKRIKELGYTLMRVKPAHRADLLDRLGLEKRGDQLVHKGNDGVGVPAGKLTVAGNPNQEVKPRLTGEEYQLLVAVGRYKGVDKLPPGVNVATVDWSADWEGKFGRKAAAEIATKLHGNYVEVQLAKLAERGAGLRASTTRAADHPLIRLAADGVVVAPSDRGYRAHMAGRKEEGIPVSNDLRDRLDRIGYGKAEYEQMHELLRERQKEDQGQGTTQRQKAGVPLSQAGSTTGSPKRWKQWTLRDNLAFELGRSMLSNLGSAKRSGLYQMLNTMDEDEQISYQQRGTQRNLRT